MSQAIPLSIVGIGASAGGIEALEGFFRGLPADPGLAIVIVTHLSPERESRLHEVIGHYTRLRVQVAEDGQRVERNHVYVMPSNAILGMKGGRLRLRKPEAGMRERKPVDVFLSELGVDQGERAAGVILSGGDGDGTLGIKVIKEHGGLALAQVADGHGPSHPGMPDSAIATGLVDFAVPVEEMGATLVSFARGTDLLDGISGDTRRGEAAHALVEARQEICAILRNQVGHDFSGYKPRTFLRRVQRRMQVVRLDSVAAYLELLRRDPQELAALFRDLLISVTNFFRDADAFEVLATQVIPKLFEGRGARDAVRIWVPGCATGEEVFSIAMLLRETMDGLSAAPQVQIFATDIDENALGVARAGRYPAALLDNISPERRARFFIADGGTHVVAKEVRELCVFSPHSVLRDPPFSRIDLVSCRNLLIYFGPEAQNQVIPVFHYALRPEGYLFLGTSENVSGFSDLFLPVEKKQRIFQRRTNGAPALRLPMQMGAVRPDQAGPPTVRHSAAGTIALRQAVEAQVLDRFAPAFVVVNGDGDITYFSARTGRYLESAAGMPTRQLMTMARRGLRLELRSMLREAVETGLPVTRGSVAVEDEPDRVQLVTLTIEPLRQGQGSERLFLVVFLDEGPALSRVDAEGRVTATQDGAALRLEQELREARERLQSLIEEYETALEELKASNEELVSLNEELQSTNEELEASKEEQQSTNEELHTVNLELHSKVDALDRAHDDLRNLFESSNVATVFLDRNKGITSFTPTATQVLNLLPSDLGRPITDLSSPLPLPDLAGDIDAVLASGMPFERRLKHEERQVHYLIRLSPYRNSSRGIAGVVLSFVDITGLTQAEEQQRILIAELQHRTRNLLNVVQAIVVQTLGKDGTPAPLTERLAALGRVQGLISEARGDAVGLAEIVQLELKAYADPAEGRVSIAGPHLALSFDHVQTMALVLHELTTNAVKHGALGNRGGTLAVGWQVAEGAEGRSLVLEWRESGVAMPKTPPGRGFGRELIERALTYTARAKAELLFGADGISCRIAMPLDDAGRTYAGAG